jgi:hypothetical protein
LSVFDDARPPTRIRWQVDLGGDSIVDRAEVWHRSDCCPGRLHNAKVIVSSTPDFTAGGLDGDGNFPGTCGTLMAHCQVDGSSCDISGADNPEVTACGGTTGRYLTLFNREVQIDHSWAICEVEVRVAMGRRAIQTPLSIVASYDPYHGCARRRLSSSAACGQVWGARGDGPSGTS